MEKHGFYLALLFLNILSFIFLVIIFISSFVKKFSFDNGFCIFWFIISLTVSFCIYSIFPEPKHFVRNTSIISSVLLVIIPILFYIIRVQFTDVSLKSRLIREFAHYNSMTAVIEDEMRNPGRTADTNAQFAAIFKQQ
jgi:hypothetical protein